MAKIKTKASKKQLDCIACSSDASGVEGNAIDVFYPCSAEEIKKITVLANNITARGGGTGLVGGAVPLNSVVIDMSKLNKVIELDRQKKIVYVEAGVILDELNNKLEKFGLEFPINPSSHAVCTIGGMIATNAAGSRAIKYGRTSNWIENFEIINSKGETEKLGKADINDYAGMEGTTGIIVKAKLKLIKKPKRTASLMKFNELDDLVRRARELKLDKDVSMIEFLDKKTSELLGFDKLYHLIVEYESENGKNEKGEFKDKEYEKIMNLRDSTYPKLASVGYTIIEDPKLFLLKINEFIEFLEKNNIPCFGHIGSGILHPCFNPDEKNSKKKIEQTIKLARQSHGNVTGEHGIGILKKQFLEITEKKLISVVKNRLDKQNKFNPGKIIDFTRSIDDKDEKAEETKIEEKIEEQSEKKTEEDEKAKEESKNGS